MVKRSQLSSFMANAYVYPGGLAEKSDFSLEWLKVFEQCGISFETLRTEFVDGVQGPRPPMIEKPLTIAHNQKKVRSVIIHFRRAFIVSPHAKGAPQKLLTLKVAFSTSMTCLTRITWADYIQLLMSAVAFTIC